MDRQVVVTDVSDRRVDQVTERQMLAATKVYFQEKGYVVCTQCERNPPEGCAACPHRETGYEGRVHGVDVVARGG